MALFNLEIVLYSYVYAFNYAFTPSTILQVRKKIIQYTQRYMIVYKLLSHTDRFTIYYHTCALLQSSN